MKFNFLKFFLPQDKKFFVLFDKAALNLQEAAKVMYSLVTTMNKDERTHYIREIERLEHVGDEITHEIHNELSRNFITPFDREDIHYLASALDDIADYIFATAKKINFYRVSVNDIGMQKLSEIIMQSCNEVRKAVGELRNMKNMRVITESLVKINSLENEADDIFDMSIERLFATEPDAKEVIKRREIYQVMETATDKCEDAANVIESIIVKYA